ncbi:ATP-binding cassette domain-containing protein [Arcanobacterium canis]|uniref:ABC transporter ATP-binding protein n=1 Tax=Arcanobacterium canis TaxID=999183 RepID=A0ABY8G1G1_9ACTO|nr:ABC transporter ATP-binding protein [Arcanobacterium canis]WFM83908.1 ABC transporter ATP-binding protein [Arcanobacterium canis]
MNELRNYPDWLWALRYGWQASPAFATASTIMLLGVALIPAVNVLLIRQLSNSLSHSHGAIGLIILTGLVFGAGGALQQVANTLSRVNAMRVNAFAADHFDCVLARSSARSYASELFMDKLRKARQCTSEGHVSSQFQATINIFTATITASTLALTLWDLSQGAAMISVLAPIPTAVAYAWYGRQESRLWPEAAQKNRRSVYFQDQISYQSTGSELVNLRASSFIASRSQEMRALYRKIRENLEGLAVVSDAMSGLATTVLFCLALVFLYRDSAQDAGAVFAGIAGLMSGIGAMAGIGYQIGELVTSIPANRHFRDFLRVEDDRVTELDIASVQNFCANDITVRYGDVVAVRSANLATDKGTLVAIVGENGSGKTSLIRAMMGSQPEASGSLKIGALSVDLSSGAFRYPYAVVQQDYGHYELTVREFLTMGLNRNDISESEIDEALRFAEAYSFVSELADGVQTLLGAQWGGVNLSGGQWQRLTIARAYLSDAPVWFLDEPTSAIDAPTEELIFHKLSKEASKRIIILTTHRVSTLRSTGFIYVMKKGTIVEEGTFGELLSHESEFKQMFHSQLENTAAPLSSASNNASS